MSFVSEGEKNDEFYKEGERWFEVGYVGSFVFVDVRG